MLRFTILLSFLLFMQTGFAQDKPAYQLFNVNGKKSSYKKLLQEAEQADIVLFGEFHDNPICHWLQLELTKDLYERKKLVLGAEMFERDNQEALTAYVQGKLSAKGLDSNARLWNNYKTDYAPLVNFAKEKQLVFAATNVPRRFASMVAKNGFEVLNNLKEEEKKWIAPLPMPYDSTLPGYVNMLKMMGGHGGANLPKAQAVKDATMAWFILQYFVPGSLFIHYNGAYHSDNREGIVWYLNQYRPELKILTITTVSQKDPARLEEANRGKADFIIAVDEDMTSTF